MKKLIFSLSLVLIATGIFAQVTGAAPAKVQLKNSLDSLNYAAGMTAASNAKRSLGAKFDPKCSWRPLIA